MKVIHFNELKRLVSGISSTVLAGRLSELEREGLVNKKQRSLKKFYKIRQVGHQMEGSKVIAKANSKKCKKPLTTPFKYVELKTRVPSITTYF
jgi:hypothetical protein